MSGVVSGNSEPFSIPNIDIAPYLQDPESKASESIVEEVRKACLSTGFFQITGHGVPTQVQQGFFNGAKKFFALPFEAKKALDCKKTVGHRGYDVLASQSYQEGVLPDMKEGFYVAEDMPLEDPRVAARRFFMGPNVWPQELAPADFQQPAEAYLAAITHLTERVLALIAQTLPFGPGIFDDFVSHNPCTPLRVLHYPPTPATEADGARNQFGSSAHTDFGAITLLLQDENPGLEVLDTATDTWVPLDPNPGAYVVNIGDMLSMWTSGRYKSSWHRVINKQSVDRYSIVFFYDGNLDCPLAPLDGTPVKGRVLTVEDHMIKRITDSYGKSSKSK